VKSQNGNVLFADAQGVVCRDGVRTRWFRFDWPLNEGEQDAIMKHLTNAMPVWSPLLYYRETKRRWLFFQRHCFDSTLQRRRNAARQTRRQSTDQ